MTISEEDVPRSPEAERAVLGAILVEEKALARIQGSLRAGDFQAKPHQRIFQVVMSLLERGVSIDSVALVAELRTSGDLESVGGPAYIGSLIEGVPRSSNVEHHAHIVKEMASNRAAIEAADAFIRSLVSRNGAGPGEASESFKAATATLRQALDALGSDPTSSNRLVPVEIGSWDPLEAVPCIVGDAAGDVLIAEADLVLLVGEVEGGKTMWTIAFAVAQSLGQSFLGFAPHTERRVSVVLTDGDGEDQAKRRAARLALGFGVQPSDLDRCGRFRLMVPDQFNLDDRRAFLELERHLADFDPDVLCIETVSSLMGPERNAWHQGSVADFISTRLRPLQNRPDGRRRTMIVGTHLIKPNNALGGGRIKDRVSGSHYILGGVDAAISLEPAGQESFKVRPCKRSRWGCSFHPFIAIVKGQGCEPLELINRGPLTPSKADHSEEENRFLQDAAAVASDGGVFLAADIKRRRGIQRTDSAQAKAIDRLAKRLVRSGALTPSEGKGGYRLAKSADHEAEAEP